MEGPVFIYSISKDETVNGDNYYELVQLLKQKIKTIQKMWQTLKRHDFVSGQPFLTGPTKHFVFKILVSSCWTTNIQS